MLPAFPHPPSWAQISSERYEMCVQHVPVASEVPCSNACTTRPCYEQALGLWLDSVAAANTEPLLTQNSLSGWWGWVSAASDSCRQSIRGFSLSSIHVNDCHATAPGAQAASGCLMRAYCGKKPSPQECCLYKQSHGGLLQECTTTKPCSFFSGTSM